MKQAGVFDDCAAAISWHPTDDNGIWSINFHAQQKVIYSFKGKRAADALQIFLMGATMSDIISIHALSYVPQFFHRAMMQTWRST